MGVLGVDETEVSEGDFKDSGEQQLDGAVSGVKVGTEASEYENLKKRESDNKRTKHFLTSMKLQNSH